MLIIDNRSEELYSSFVVYSIGCDYDFPLAVVLLMEDAELLVKQAPGSRYYEECDGVINIG